AVIGGEPGPHLVAVDGDRPRIHASGALDDPRRPQLLEVERERVRELAGARADDDVLLSRPGVVRPVEGPGPDGVAVADHVLVVHQVGDARDRARRSTYRHDVGWVAFGWRRHGDRPRVVDVVGDAGCDTAGDGRLERADDDRLRLAVEAKIVEGHV